MRISELAERSGVAASTLRYYERVGLLVAGRTAAGYRAYGEGAVERLGFIGVGKDLGLSLGEIGELLPVWEGGDCAEVKAGLEFLVRARLGRAEARVSELGGFVASLRDALRRFGERSADGEPCDSGCGCLGAATEFAGVRSAVEIAATRASSATDSASSDARSDLAVEGRPGALAACSLDGRDMKARIERWRAALEGVARIPVSEGIRLDVPVERAVMITELAVAEQKCCSFFDFRARFRGLILEFEVRAPGEAWGAVAAVFGEPGRSGDVMRVTGSR